MTRYYPQKPSATAPSVPVALPNSPLSALHRPERYIPDEGLVDAVNVALMLRQPLMVTGEPGTGKTMLAASIAREIGLPPPLVFETKSTSQSKDLFYSYDTLGRFTAKELATAGAADAKEYLSFNALGEAIVRSNAPSAVADILPSGFQHSAPLRSVVLIDEVEKAPRDFPNDILNEIERMYFRIPELGNRRVAADGAYDPVVIMTNNSEKSLPDAFLRRCIYYNIPFPSGERMIEIVLSRLPDEFDDGPRAALLRDAVSFVLHIRGDAVQLEKNPGTSELLGWLSAMIALGADASKPLSTPDQRKIALQALCSLAKISGDQRKVSDVLGSWRSGTA